MPAAKSICTLRPRAFSPHIPRTVWQTALLTVRNRSTIRAGVPGRAFHTAPEGEHPVPQRELNPVAYSATGLSGRWSGSNKKLPKCDTTGVFQSALNDVGTGRGRRSAGRREDHDRPFNGFDELGREISAS